MTWISLNDEQPYLGQFIIVSDGSHVGEAIYFSNIDFMIFNHKMVQPWIKITHWMPLPEAPVDHIRDATEMVEQVEEDDGISVEEKIKMI